MWRHRALSLCRESQGSDKPHVTSGSGGLWGPGWAHRAAGICRPGLASQGPEEGGGQGREAHVGRAASAEQESRVHG